MSKGFSLLPIPFQHGGKEVLEGAIPAVLERSLAARVSNRAGDILGRALSENAGKHLCRGDFFSCQLQVHLAWLNICHPISPVGFFEVRSIWAARIGKGIREKMQPHAGKHLENFRKAKPDGALGLKSLLFEPLGAVCEKMEVWKHWVVGQKGSREKTCKS